MTKRCVELDQEAALAVWPDVVGLVVQALRTDPTNETSGDDIHQQLAKKYASLLACLNAQGELDGVCVVQLYMLRGRRVLHVLALAGAGMDEWLDDLVEELRAMAGRQEAVAVTMSGRPGWARQLTKYGFKSAHVTMRMEVDHGRVREIDQSEPQPVDTGIIHRPAAGAVPAEPARASAEPGV